MKSVIPLTCKWHVRVQTRDVHKRIVVCKQGWAIIILKCQRGHDNVHKHIAVYKQGWALAPVEESDLGVRRSPHLIHLQRCSIVSHQTGLQLGRVAQRGMVLHSVQCVNESPTVAPG
jgi:hypothetical protein